MTAWLLRESPALLDTVLVVAKLLGCSTARNDERTIVVHLRRAFEGQRLFASREPACLELEARAGLRGSIARDVAERRERRLAVRLAAHCIRRVSSRELVSLGAVGEMHAPNDFCHIDGCRRL